MPIDKFHFDGRMRKDNAIIVPQHIRSIFKIEPGEWLSVTIERIKPQ